MKSACNTLTYASSEVLQYSETSLNIQECYITLQLALLYVGEWDIGSGLYLIGYCLVV